MKARRWTNSLRHERCCASLTNRSDETRASSAAIAARIVPYVAVRKRRANGWEAPLGCKSMVVNVSKGAPSTIILTNVYSTPLATSLLMTSGSPPLLGGGASEEGDGFMPRYILRRTSKITAKMLLGASLAHILILRGERTWP